MTLTQRVISLVVETIMTLTQRVISLVVETIMTLTQRTISPVVETTMISTKRTISLVVETTVTFTDSYVYHNIEHYSLFFFSTLITFLRMQPTLKYEYASTCHYDRCVFLCCTSGRVQNSNNLIRWSVGLWKNS